MAAGENIILVGFMGAGKSSVGRLLAKRLGRCFVETDDLIVGRGGRGRAGGLPAAGARRSGSRPMLEGKPKEEVAALYHGREPYYRQAHLVVETAGLGVDQVVRRILFLLPPRGGSA